ncbi:MAG: glycosyltransferase 87 family protein [Micromonosporaceae bacterium]
MTHFVAPALLLAAGLALCVVAQRSGWAPSLRAALAVGAVLRVVVWIIAATSSWQPYDFHFDFSGAAAAVLHHHDPMLSVRARGWPFLPTMAFLMAGELKLGQLTHLSWPVAGRLVPVLADLALIPLVGRLAGERAALRRFQYACNPIAIMVCAIHGQLEPEVLALGVGALLLARSRRSAASGLALGLSMAVGSWSLLLAPGILIALPDWRHRLRAALCAIAVPVVILLTSPLTVGTPVGRLPDVVRGVTSLRPVIGNWGWTALVTRGHGELSPLLGRVGTIALIAALLTAGYLWRRADSTDLTSALLITFLLVSPRVGAQYFAWPLPYLTARPTRYAAPALAVATAWAGFGYLFLSRQFLWFHSNMWALASWCVIPLLFLAMPWARRRPAGGPQGVPGDDAVVPQAVTESSPGPG